jgi:beta-galactosidase GanA
MNEPTPRFPAGASYYPPHHDPEQWAADVANMAEAGMSCIRSAELLASWDYIEKLRGAPDWGWLDALFEAAQRRGVGILLGTGSPSPPIWLLDRYPDVQILDREGRAFPTGTVWGWACRNHPGYRAEVERFLGLLIGRYAGHPALWAWQIDNEPGYPFVNRRGEEHARIFDYNPHTEALFRQWLEAKYGTLDALNVAWRWDCTHHQYAEWAQVRAPRSMPQEWGVVTAWLDWRTFLNQNMAAFVRWQHEIIKARDQRHPTMTNIFAFSGREVEMALDPWLMARQCDAIGYDLYPGIGRRLHKEPEYISLFLDIGRSTALHARAEFWLPELESGPISGWALGPDYTTKPADITRYNLEALGHGAKAILYQGYREWPCIPIHWGALADFEGRPTPRYNAAQQVNAMLARHAELFLKAQPPRAQVGIFYDTRNATLLHGTGALGLLSRCVRGAYKTLWRAGYDVEFVDSAALGGGDLPYKLILLPAALLLEEAAAATLARFVEAGGTLIGFAKCAWVDGRGWSWARQPGAGLEALFGATADEIERDDNCKLEIGEWEAHTSGAASHSTPSISNLRSPIVNGYWHRQPLRPHPESAVLARFEDGSAAAVHRRVGAGQTYYLGTHLDAAALEDEGAAALLLALAESAGIERPLRVAAGGAPLDAHLLTDGDRRLAILTNNGPAPASARITLPGAAAPHVAELLTGAPLELSLAEGAFTVELEIAGWGGAVILAEPN